MAGFFLAIGQTLWVRLGLYFWEARTPCPERRGFLSMLVAVQGTFNHWGERESFTNARSTGVLQWW